MTTPDVIVPKKDKVYKCVNRVSQQALDNGADERKFVNMNQTIRAKDFYFDKPKDKIIFTDGELEGRKLGENIIATLSKIDQWTITELAL